MMAVMQSSLNLPVGEGIERLVDLSNDVTLSGNLLVFVHSILDALLSKARDIRTFDQGEP